MTSPAEPARSERLALGAALVTVLLWASAFVGIRDAGRDLSAGPLSLGRLLVGAVALGLIVLARRDALPPRADVPRLIAVGLLWFGAYNVLLNAAEQSVDAGTASMLVNIGPVFIALLAGLLLARASRARSWSVAPSPSWGRSSSAWRPPSAASTPAGARRCAWPPRRPMRSR